MTALLAWALAIIAGCGFGFVVVVVWLLNRLCDRQIQDALDCLNADEFIAELRAVPPVVPVRASYSTERTPVALRALAALIAEDAARLEAQQTARIAVRP